MYVGRDQWIQQKKKNKEIFGNEKKRKEQEIFAPKYSRGCRD